MKKIRIHNDIRISWGITTNGQQESLEGKVLQVQLVVYNQMIEIEDFSVTGNVIVFDFPGEKQKYCGTYTLVCRDITDGNLNTLDKTDAFELVPHTADEAGVDNDKVALEVVSLATDRDSSTIGKAATVRIGNVYTLPSGSQAYVRNVGTINNAILEFGIPSGTDGDGGIDGIGVVADPSSVTFNTDKSGNISSDQDKLVRMKLYIGGQVAGDAKIVSITPTNFKSPIAIEKDGSSFYIRGSNLSSVDTIDLDGNAVTVPCTQAEAYVVCKMGDSSVLYAATVRVYTNTQSFYTSLVSNQREFKQTFTELNNTLTDQGLQLEKYHSEFQQTAQNISMSVSKLKTDTEGTIEDAKSNFEVRADKIESTVESNKTELDGKIEKNTSKITQTAEEINATVEKYKTDTDGKIESARSEFSQTAEEIKATVESNKKDADGKIEKNTSLISQTATEIKATVSANKELADQGIEDCNSLISQTATQIRQQVSDNKTYLDGRIDDCNSSITQTATQIRQSVSDNKTYLDGRIDDCNSNISQTANQIQQQVSSLQTDVNGNIQNLQSQITQNANSISVANSRFNSDGSLKNTSGLLTTADKASLVSKDYVDGKVISSAEISTMIKNGISTATIEADNVNLEGHTMKFGSGEITIDSTNFKLDSSGNVTMAGKITASEGKIAGFQISGDGLTNTGFNNDAYVVFRNDSHKVFAGIGGNVLSASTGARAVARFENNNTANYYGSTNYAMYVAASGSSDNVAIYLASGCIQGLRIKTDYMTTSGTISRGVNSVLLFGTGTYVLPEMRKEDDGYVLFLKRVASDDQVTIQGGVSYNSSGTKKTSYIIADGTSANTFSFTGNGNAVILVYHRDVNMGNYSGAWAMFKCPRDW